MSLPLYDTGYLFYVPAEGSPVKFGGLEDISLDFERNLILNHGQFQQPIRALNGAGTIRGTAKFAKLDGRIITQAYFGEQAVAGGKKVKLNAAFNVPASGPYTVTPLTAFPSLTFFLDLGVTVSGEPLVKVDSSPADGEYSVNASTGVYTFNAAQAGVAVQISYGYTTTAGYSLDFTNPLTQVAPTFGVMLMNKLSCEQLTIWLPRCSSEQFGLDGRLEQYGVAGFTFVAIADPNSHRVGIFSFGG